MLRFQMAVIKHCDSLQPLLLSDPDSSLSDSEESVFSGLEDSGSDTSDEDTEEVAGVGCDKDSRTEKTSEEQEQVGEGLPWALLCVRGVRKRKHLPWAHTVLFMVFSGTRSSNPCHTFELQAISL